MDLGLKGRTALVTGSSAGIGCEIAFRLAEEGANVIIHGRNPDKVRTVSDVIRHAAKEKIKVYEFVADVTKPYEIKTWFETEMPKISQLDILVNNIGGIAGKKRFEEIGDQEWLDSFNFNFMTAERFTKLALPYLKKSNQARIINMSSLPALQPGKYNNHYAVPKVGLINFTEYLSSDLAEYGILVNAILPNTIMGGAWDRNIENIAKTDKITRSEAHQKLEELTKAKAPLKRIGTMQEVANVVVFLASKQASFVTGNCIFVDGGEKRSIF